MATQQSIDHLVGLAVAMLGVAPGTDWLNARAKQLDGGATLADIANDIQSSAPFEARYPAFLSNERFAKDFLEALLGDRVTDAVMTATVDFVTPQLEGETSRGELALALVSALTIIGGEGGSEADMAFRALHSENYGKAAEAFHSKLMVAKHYTEEARIANPSSASVLEGVTDAASAMEAIENIKSPPVEGQTIRLKAGPEKAPGTSADDIFVAAPVAGSSDLFLETLDLDDEIDGLGGTDTIRISGPNVDIPGAVVKNVEVATINTSGSINADMSEWAGLESVEITRFGSASDVTVIVDGASVSVKGGRTFNGDATIVGAKGAVDINAGEESVVHVGSAGHTETVMVKGGASVLVDSGAAAADKKQSETVTKVVVDGVEQGAVTGRTDAKPATFNTDDVREVQPIAGLEYVEINDNDDGYTPALSARDLQLRPYYWLDQVEDRPLNGGTVVTLGPTQILVTRTLADADGYKTVDAVAGTSGTVEPTVTVNSDAIETIQLHNTNAVAVVTDNSEKKDDDDKDIPDRAPLSVAVEDFDGVLRLEGGAVSDDITFTVVKASDFDLVASTKMVTVEGDAKLTLDIDGSAETITVSGKGGVTMAGLSGMNTLKTIDASGSSGANHFRSQADDKDGPTDKDELKALTMVKGGSGKDTVTLVTSPKGKLEHIDTGDGGDMVTITGAHRTKGLEVDLGIGDDTFAGDSGGNKDSRIDGGEGTDTLKLSATPATYKDGDDTKSIFSNFDVLDVGGGTGTFDVELLGIGTGNVLATGGTNGAVTLKNMAVNMGITVKAEKKGAATTADITHDLVEVRREQDLNINLEAIGNDKDTEAGTTGEVTLTLEVDSIDRLFVDSSAKVGGSKTEAPAMAPEAADYSNTLTLNGASSDVRDIVVTGDASLTISGTGLGDIESVDATKSGGGVTFTAVTGASRIELFGGAGDDMLDASNNSGANYEINGGEGDDTLTAGSGGGKLTGGAGADTLIGNSAADMFIIEDASDSRLSFNSTGGVEGVDMIGNATFAFDGSTDRIALHESLYEKLEGGFNAGLNTSVQTALNTAGGLTKAFVDEEKDGFFETDGSGGINPRPEKHSAVVVEHGGNTWLFIDIGFDGNLDIETDIVIQFVGTVASTISDTTIIDEATL